MENALSKEIEKHFLEDKKNSKYYAVMLFDTELHLGISTNPNKWVNYKNLYFSSGALALNTYANIPCPASQLIDGETEQDLLDRMEEMINNFSDEEWLKGLYETL